MLQMAEKEIRLKERRIKELEDYIVLLETKGVNKDDKEILEQKKKLEAMKAASSGSYQPQLEEAPEEVLEV